MSTVQESTSVQAAVRAFILDNFLFGDDREFGETESLLQSNIIDSTGILELVQFLEETYEIAIADEEMVPENLDSLGNIARFVGTKRAT